MPTLPKQAQIQKERKRESKIELLFKKQRLIKEIQKIDEDLVVLNNAIEQLDELQKLFKKDW
jgi:hypothetical protein